MALLFQSNPDQWDLRRYLRPGKTIKWYVSRYRNLMIRGEVALFWEAQGKQPAPVRGLYGWGYTLDEPARDDKGRHRIPVKAVERWYSSPDEETAEPETHIAPVAASLLLDTIEWQEHLLNVMPVGTNFLVTGDQLLVVERLVATRVPDSRFSEAVSLALADRPLDEMTWEPGSLIALGGG